MESVGSTVYVEFFTGILFREIVAQQNVLRFLIFTNTLHASSSDQTLLYFHECRLAHEI